MPHPSGQKLSKTAFAVGRLLTSAARIGEQVGRCGGVDFGTEVQIEGTDGGIPENVASAVGVIARFVSSITLREDQPTERFQRDAPAIL